MYRIGEEEVQAVREALLSKRMWRYQQGSQTKLFEQALAEKMDASYVLALSSGTGALMAALTALGVGPGDEVLVPAYTYIAVAGWAPSGTWGPFPSITLKSSPAARAVPC